MDESRRCAHLVSGLMFSPSSVTRNGEIAKGFLGVASEKCEQFTTNMLNAIRIIRRNKLVHRNHVAIETRVLAEPICRPGIYSTASSIVNILHLVATCARVAAKHMLLLVYRE